MESSEVQSRDIQVRLPVISTRRRGERIATVSSRSGTKSFIAHCNHMIGIKRLLDVCGSRVRPIVNYGTIPPSARIKLMLY